MCVHHMALGKVYQRKHRGFYPGQNCPAEDRSALGVCEQHHGGQQRRWAWRMAEQRNSCLPLGAVECQQGEMMGGPVHQREGDDGWDGGTGSRGASGCAKYVSVLRATELICYGVDIGFERKEKQR